MLLQVICEVLLILPFLYTCESIGISGKLDFGDSHSPSLIRSNDASTFKTIKSYEKTSGDNFEGIGVVCVSGGCNTTNGGSSISSTSSTSDKDTVQTDVVVHVKTKVDLSKNKALNDTPDIPVVLGYKGTNLDTTNEDIDRSLSVQPLVVTDIEDELNKPLFVPSRNSFGTTSRTSFNSISSSQDSPYQPVVNPSLSEINPSSTLPSVQPSYSPVTGNPVYGIQTEPRVDITIKSLPPVSLTTDLNKNIIKNTRYNVDTTRYNVSPFYNYNSNPAYYGQHNPPQPFVWYPKRTGNNFRNYQSSFNQQNSWNSKTPEVYHRHSTNGINTCICKNEADLNRPNLQWYPNDNVSNRRIDNNDPGSQINDKLAPLD